ncbi:MAG: hypothetical protein ABI144_04150 [Gallionella sp.]
MQTPTRKNEMQILNKVPEVMLFFWIIKIMCTTVGETAADFLNADLNFGLTGTSLIMGFFLALFLVMQLRSKKYIPWLYWIVVVLVSIVGTLITDNLVDNFGVALETTTIVFSLALLATFWLWHAKEKTLSVHTIVTRQRELFYWAAILFTFALGTAAGDWVAEGLSLGYANSTLMFAGMIAIVTITYYGFRANAILAFWIAYILTRPLGASFGDYLSQPVGNGGLGLGPAYTNAGFLSAILALVIYLTVSRRDAKAGA